MIKSRWMFSVVGVVVGILASSCGSVTRSRGPDAPPDDMSDVSDSRDASVDRSANRTTGNSADTAPAPASDADNTSEPERDARVSNDHADASASLSDAGGSAAGTVLWNGNPSQGSSVFKVPNVESGSTISTAMDSELGLVWKFSKPAGSNRCEGHGAAGFKPKEGDLVYIGWKFKLAMPQTQTTNAIFQWKSYPADQQNYPVILKTISGEFVLMQRNPGSKITYLWKAPTVTGAWQSVVLAINVSRDITKGYVEFWFNGQQQKLSNGSTRFTCRTLDDHDNDPKWGIYGAADSEVTNYVQGLKIATTYAAAAP